MYNGVIQSPNFYRVGLYIRLSEADENKSYESESESIVNQRNLLLNYVKIEIIVGLLMEDFVIFIKLVDRQYLKVSII